MDTNPPVLWLQVRKPRPDSGWELQIPTMGKLVKVTEEMDRALDELYLEGYLLPVPPLEK